jgi:hypothetical protein
LVRADRNDLVQVALQEIELPFHFLHFLERGALRGNEETSILAADVPQKGNPDGCRVVRSAGLDVQLTAPKTCMASPPRGFSSEPLRIGPHAEKIPLELKPRIGRDAEAAPDNGIDRGHQNGHNDGPGCRFPDPLINRIDDTG